MTTVTVNLEPGAKGIFDEIRRAKERALSEAIWGTRFPSGGILHWPSPKPSVIPVFVEPERPAPEQPETDTPAVAVLKTLLAQREAVLEGYEYDIESTQSEIEDLERQLTDLRADLQHATNCAEAAEEEVEQIKSDIITLGGSVD